jgi:catechol 2,3-dioxygenase-like lactoylglutathione lyase family enzyme
MMKDIQNNVNAILDTIIIQTDRIMEIAEFYREGLSLDPAIPTGDDHLGFSMPNVYFGFDFVQKPPASTGVLSLWFEVDDLSLTFEKFKRLGARVKYPPTRKPWGAYLAALYDPDGNVFGLSQRREGKSPM